MRAIATAVAVLACPALADARPVTVGVALGRIESEHEPDGEANSTRQLFGRLGLTARVSGQLELQKIENGNGTSARSGTVLLVAELGSNGRLVPVMFAGIGIDRATDSYGYESEGSHIEGGLGLEYRSEAGLTLGADVRLGGRSVEQREDVYLRDALLIYIEPALPEGEYRSGRLYAAIRF